jgi:hypothetical protein
MIWNSLAAHTQALVKCYMYGAETWTLRQVDQKYMESLKCDAGEGWRRSIGQIV